MNVWTPERIKNALQYETTRPPEAALLEALAHPDQYRPLLIQMIEHAAYQPGSLPPDAMGHHYAMILLAYHRDPDAFDALLALLRLNQDLLDYVLRDSLEQRLARCLASTCSGRFQLLLQSILDPVVSGYAKVIAIHALIILYLQLDLDRPELMGLARQIFEKLPCQLELIPWDLVIKAFLEIHPIELQSEIQHVLDLEIIPAYFLSASVVSETLKRDQAQLVQLARQAAKNQLILEPVDEVMALDVFKS